MDDFILLFDKDKKALKAKRRNDNSVVGVLGRRAILPPSCLHRQKGIIHYDTP